jgi:hypothetical protein
MIISNIKLRNILLALYSLSIPYSIYYVLTKDIYSKIAKNGHLEWDWIWLKENSILYIIWSIFLVFGLFYENLYIGGLYGLGLLGVSYYNYKNDKTYSSMWCWFANSIMLYYAAYLLVYLPFLERV